MPPNNHRPEGAEEAVKNSETNVLSRVLDQNRMTQIRREIGIIADRSHREYLISDEAYEEYRELAEGREEHEVSAELLESARKFAADHEAKAIRIHKKIEHAMRQKIASESDEEFLMENLVIENIKFAGQAAEIEGLIDAKLARMKKDKERYNTLAAHPLIEELGYLELSSGSRLEFPDEEAFLELSVPERRELLKQLEDAVPKAEIYAESREAKTKKERISVYTSRLKLAKQEGVIGDHTYKEFLEEFKELDDETMKEWDDSFDTQMQRYKDFWKDVRVTLRGPALMAMESKIDACGYSELTKEFEKMTESESERLTGNYALALGKYQQEGIIGQHTVDSFMDRMGEQELSDKYKAEGKLSGEMVDYRVLWAKIDELPEKQQDFMRSNIDEWDITELTRQYNAFTGQGIANDNSDSRILSTIRSSEVKSAIVETDGMLVDRGRGKRKEFTTVIGRMFKRVSREAFDATSFEAELRKKVAKDNPHIKRDLRGRGADDRVDFDQIGEDADLLEESGKAQVTDINGFVQVESQGESGLVSRETQLTINEDNGLERFFVEDGQHSYRSDQDGGQDAISLAAYTNSGRTVELDLQEIQTLEKYLKFKEEEEQELPKAVGF